METRHHCLPPSAAARSFATRGTKMEASLPFTVLFVVSVHLTHPAGAEFAARVPDLGEASARRHSNERLVGPHQSLASRRTL